MKVKCKNCRFYKADSGALHLGKINDPYACFKHPEQPMYTADDWGCDEGEERRDVYVVLSETPDDGSVVTAVYSKLDDALAHVRSEWAEYLERKDHGAIEWNNPKACGHYGWYDTDVSFGCYVYARELKEEFNG